MSMETDPVTGKELFQLDALEQDWSYALAGRTGGRTMTADRKPA
jgi:hypothetical protein